MPFRISITDVAEASLRGFSARERRTLEAAVVACLSNEPTTPTNAIKRLRPNPLAEFEIRAGDLRVLYIVEGDEVILLIVGRKVGNQLVVEGEEFHGHQDDPPEPAGSGPGGNAD